MLFASGYLAIMAEESMVVNEYMHTHLQELFEDIEVYGWKSVKDYHAACSNSGSKARHLGVMR